ncbi:MAG: DNA repair protein RecO [Clostridia bacterium]|nr:DNA repair protein RecO [Clostridia bacterium]
MEEIKVKGLVVRETAQGDYDKILTLLTNEMGRITVTAKGVKSIRSKNIVACQLFTYSHFLLRKTKKYYYVVETDTIENFFGIKDDLDKLALASYICDVAAELSVEDMPDPELLRLTLNTLFAIGYHDDKPRALVKAAFEVRASAISGFLPDLSQCALCGCEPKGDMYLDVMNGRILCRDCKPVAEAEEITSESGTARLYHLISPTVLYAMRYIVSASAERFLSFNVEDDELYLLGRVAESYLCNHIEHSFYTLEFYKSLLI